MTLRAACRESERYIYAPSLVPSTFVYAHPRAASRRPRALSSLRQSSAISVATNFWTCRHISFTSAWDLPCGSGMGQSRRTCRGRVGHWSPHPIVMTRSQASATSALQGLLKGRPNSHTSKHSGPLASRLGENSSRIALSTSAGERRAADAPTPSARTDSIAAAFTAEAGFEPAEKARSGALPCARWRALAWWLNRAWAICERPALWPARRSAGTVVRARGGACHGAQATYRTET
jgi:hypothetical protein